jgi:hypothetical protein
MSDDTDLIKAGAQGITEGVMAPFADLLRKLAGPVAEELGLTLQDEVRVFRLKRRIRLLERVQQMLNEKGVEPQRVPLKILVPVIEGASLEEDDELQDRWAALLVNTATTGGAMPAAPEILRQLTSMDVFLLQVCFDHVVDAYRAPNKHRYFTASTKNVDPAIEKWKELTGEKYGTRLPDFPREGPPWVWGVTVDNVIRLGLLRPNVEYNDATGTHLMTVMTDLGYRFVELCQESPPAWIRKFDDLSQLR